MAHSPIIERLQIDPGNRTLGELIQDREASLHEIRQLQAEINRLRARANQRPKASNNLAESAPYRGGTLRIVKTKAHSSSKPRYWMVGRKGVDSSAPGRIGRVGG